MFTRQDYMEKRCSHREYYSQFVNRSVLYSVETFIGRDTLLSSTDEHLNDIPLARWDQLTGYTGFSNWKWLLPTNNKRIKEAGEWLTSATAVCIAKEAARQIIEKHKEEECLGSNVPTALE